MRTRMQAGTGSSSPQAGPGSTRPRRRVAVLTWVVLTLAAGCASERLGSSDDHGGISPRECAEVIRDLILYDRGAVAFHERAIPPQDLQAILTALRPYASLCSWKVVVAAERDQRVAVLEAMQDGFRRIQRERAAEIMDRWKAAPIILVFCVPEELPDFGGVPAELMRGQALIELGAGVQSLILTARTYSIETHWIAGALLVEDDIRAAMGIPEEYRVAFFGVAGYASEEITQPMPPLENLCCWERWPG
jgi:nitroreductase